MRGSAELGNGEPAPAGDKAGGVTPAAVMVPGD